VDDFVVDLAAVAEMLEQIKAPTLVIHAGADVIHPIEQGRLLASRIAGARFVMLDSNNHILCHKIRHGKSR